MILYLDHIGLHLVTFCMLIRIGWCNRSSSIHQYKSSECNRFRSTICPKLRSFPPNAGKVTDNLPYECLPSYLTNRHAVLDEDDGTIEWTGGRRPNLNSTDNLFLSERTIIHPPGSMEDRISNLMKNWEKEIRFKLNPQQWVTTKPDKFYAINNGVRLSLPEIAQIGSYNMFLGRSEFYSQDYLNASASNAVFRTALRGGFAFEVLQVYSPPPRVSFKFRHFGRMTGALRCPMRNGTWLDVPPHGHIVEFVGVSTLNLNEQYQILDMDSNFRGETLMEKMVLGTTTERLN